MTEMIRKKTTTKISKTTRTSKKKSTKGKKTSSKLKVTKIQENIPEDAENTNNYDVISLKDANNDSNEKTYKSITGTTDLSMNSGVNRITKYINEVKDLISTTNKSTGKDHQIIAINDDETNIPLLFDMKTQPFFQINMILRNYYDTLNFYKSTLGFYIMKDIPQKSLLMKFGSIILHFSNNNQAKLIDYDEKKNFSFILRFDDRQESIINLLKKHKIQYTNDILINDSNIISIKDPNGYLIGIQCIN